MHSLAAAVFLLAAVTASMPRAWAGSPIAGFAETSAVTGLAAPTAIAFLPDGRLLVTQITGELKVRSGTSATTLVTIPVCTGGEMGLTGIAVDPNFATNGFIYLYRTASSGGCGSATGRSNEVIRVTMVGSTININTLSVLLTGIRTDLGIHNGGGLRIGPDNKLYVGVGDTGVGDNIGGPGSSTNPYAQNLNELEGKILRLNLDGSPPSDNPFVGQMGKRAEIFAFGFRNPFRFSFDPLSGALWVGDVGDQTVEEIDVVTSGKNYSWPYCEGTLPSGCAHAGDVAPIFTYPHGPFGTCIIGGAFATGAFGGLENDYFFADCVNGNVYHADVAAGRNGVVGTPMVFVSGGDGPTDVVFGPDGALYYAAIDAGQVRRVAPTGGATTTTPRPTTTSTTLATKTTTSTTTTTRTTLQGMEEQRLTGKKLQMKADANPSRRQLTVLSKDATVAGGGSAADPAVSGGSLRVVGAGIDDTYPLPSGGWKIIGHPGAGKGFTYKDRSLASGPIKLVQVKTGKLVKASGKGAALGYSLAGSPDSVDVVLTIGTRSYCMHFGGVHTFKAGKSFVAKDAPTAPSCPP